MLPSSFYGLLVPLALAQYHHHPPGHSTITRFPSPTTPSIEPPHYTVPCTVGDDSPCSSGWFCTPTTIPPTRTEDPWGGLCKDNPTPRYTVPCTVGDDSPCSSGWFCTPTTIPPTRTEDPWGGLCKDNPTPPPVTTCVMGDDTPCLPSSRCTPTTIPPADTAFPWGGQCIVGPPTSTPTPWNPDYTQSFTPIMLSVETVYTPPSKSYDSPVPTWTGRKPCRRGKDCRWWREEKCVRGRCVLW